MKWLTLSIWLLLLPVSSQAEVYKHIDEDGNVTYSQTKPKDSDNVETIKTPKFKEAPPPPKVEPAASAPTAEADAEGSEEKPIDPEEKEKIDAKNAEIEKQNCENSKSRYKQLSEAGRVKFTDEDGNLKWASDEEVKARLDKLKANVDKWCK